MPVVPVLEGKGGSLKTVSSRKRRYELRVRGKRCLSLYLDMTAVAEGQVSPPTKLPKGVRKMPGLEEDCLISMAGMHLQKNPQAGDDESSIKKTPRYG